VPVRGRGVPAAADAAPDAAEHEPARELLRQRAHRLHFAEEWKAFIAGEPSGSGYTRAAIMGERERLAAKYPAAGKYP
jgi:hypothetical protein